MRTRRFGAGRNARNFSEARTPKILFAAHDCNSFQERLFRVIFLVQPGTRKETIVLPQSDPARKSVLKNPYLYTWSAVALGAFLVVWTLFARWYENRAIESRSKEERAEKQREQDRATLEQMGGKELAIQTFYATAGVIHRGETLQLCYGVANAKTVKLEPQSNPVWPSYSRCVDVAPGKTTTYTLTISDAAGNTTSQSLEVKVH